MRFLELRRRVRRAARPDVVWAHKHRHPPIVGLLVDVTPRSFISAAKGDFLMTKAGVGREPIRHGTVLFRAGVLDNPLNEEPVMSLSVRGTVDLAFDRRAPGLGRPVIESLVGVMDAVERAIRTFEDQFPQGDPSETSLDDPLCNSMPQASTTS